MLSPELRELYLPYPGQPDRRVRVYLPEREEDEKLPVVYMTDGQNVFFEEEGQWGCWFTPRAVENERKRSGRAAIIVGIDHGGVRRDNELTPASIGKIIGGSEMDNFTCPLGEEFDAFTVNTVMPTIEKSFPVRRGRINTAFCGSSSGGLQAYFTGLSHPELFSAAGAFSPALLLYGNEDLFRWTLDRAGEDMPFLYLYSGAGDELERKIVKTVEDVWDMLLEMNCPRGLLKKVIIPEYTHCEKAWEEIFADFLKIFLDRTKK